MRYFEEENDFEKEILVNVFLLFGIGKWKQKSRNLIKEMKRGNNLTKTWLEIPYTEVVFLILTTLKSEVSTSPIKVERGVSIRFLHSEDLKALLVLM